MFQYRNWKGVRQICTAVPIHGRKKNKDSPFKHFFLFHFYFKNNINKQVNK